MCIERKGGERKRELTMRRRTRGGPCNEDNGSGVDVFGDKMKLSDVILMGPSGERSASERRQSSSGTDPLQKGWVAKDCGCVCSDRTKQQKAEATQTTRPVCEMDSVGGDTTTTEEERREKTEDGEPLHDTTLLCTR